jgi:hypothetical protein
MSYNLKYFVDKDIEGNQIQLYQALYFIVILYNSLTINELEVLFC